MVKEKNAKQIDRCDSEAARMMQRSFHIRESKAVAEGM